MGLSTSGSISLGWALVAGRKRVPRPAAGKTALRTFMGMGRVLGVGSWVLGRRLLARSNCKWLRLLVRGDRGAVPAGLGVSVRSTQRLRAGLMDAALRDCFRTHF